MSDAGAFLAACRKLELARKASQANRPRSISALLARATDHELER